MWGAQGLLAPLPFLLSGEKVWGEIPFPLPSAPHGADVGKRMWGVVPEGCKGASNGAYRHVLDGVRDGV